MPRISLWKENHSTDYKYFDRTIREMFVMGGAGIWIHKLLGTAAPAPTIDGIGDATKPTYINQTGQNIQDLLFMENRDRKYEPDIYKLRGHYAISDNDFNLSQFGLFLNNDSLFITFHINDMIERIGRKLIPGDVLEMPNMKDLWPLDESIPTSLKKYYVVAEVLRASEGYSPTWWPHLYRVKVNNMVDSQEFKDILDSDKTKKTKVKDTISPFLQNMAINDAIIAQAESDVPRSGYDTSKLYILPLNDQMRVEQKAFTVDMDIFGVDTTDYFADASVRMDTPRHDIAGYMTGDDIPPNGFYAARANRFPEEPAIGDYVLRTDYLPNTLYRWDGTKWRIVNYVERAPLTGNLNQTLVGTFFNNSNMTKTHSGKIIPEKESLHTMLSRKSDY